MLAWFAGAKGDWLIVPRLSLSETASDNLLRSGSGESADLVTQVRPGLTVRQDGARFKTNLDYNLEYLKYLDNTQFDDIFHQLQSNTNVEVFEDLLFFDVNSRLSQQNTDSRGAFTDDNRNSPNNRSDVKYYEFGPELRHAFGRWASFSARYQHSINDRASISGNTVPDRSNIADLYEVNLSSGPRLGRLQVNLSYSDRTQERTAGGDDQLKRFNSEFKYAINRTLSLVVEGGGEFNDLPASRANTRRDGATWMIGGVLSPTPRTSIDGRFGERSFGKTMAVTMSHRMRRVVFSFNYSEQIRTANQVQSETELVALNDPFGNPIIDFTGPQDINAPLGQTSLRDETSVDERITASIAYSGRRRDFTVRYFENNSSFQDSRDDEEQQGVSVNFNHQITRDARFSLSALWRDSSASTSRQSGGSMFRISPSLNYGLGRHMRVNLTYSYTDGSGNGDSNFGGFNSFGQGNLFPISRSDQDYVENALNLGLSYSF